KLGKPGRSAMILAHHPAATNVLRPGRGAPAQSRRFTHIKRQHTESCARRSALHEEASVKTGARPARDFPAIHSASPTDVGRQERVCGCSHSHRRRRTAPGRTPGCNLRPALDLDEELLEPLLA